MQFVIYERTGKREDYNVAILTETSGYDFVKLSKIMQKRNNVFDDEIEDLNKSSTPMSQRIK